MKTEKIIFLFLLIIFSTISSAQVAGISSGKLLVTNADVLEKGSIEFEPAFSVLSCSRHYNNDWDAENLNGKNVQSDLCFRLTAGITDNLEIGTSISSDVSNVSLGAKYLIIKSEDFGFLVSSGLTLPAGNKFISDSSGESADPYQFIISPVVSFAITEKSSLDFSVAYTRSFTNDEHKNQYYFGLGYGYNVTDKLQLVTELGGFGCFHSELCSAEYFIAPGFTYDVSDSFSFTLGMQYDLTGKNHEQYSGYFAAFTFSF